MNSNTENIVALLQKASDLTGVKLMIPDILTNDLPIHVSLIGQPQQNLFEIPDELAEDMAELNRPLYRSFYCKISFGKKKTCVFQNGKMTDITMSDLAQMLSQFDHAAAPVLCEIHLPNEALKNVNLQIISSGKDYTDVDWTQILMGSDYCYFALTATALLSMCERKVLRNHLLSEMPEQLGILTVNDHLILSADRGDIETSLNRFFKGRVPIFSTVQEDFSLLAASQKMASNLVDYRQPRGERSVELCLKKAIHQLDLQTQVLAEDSEALDEAMAILEEKARMLPSHMKTASRRARMQYTSQMKMDISKQASNFYQAFKEQLQKDIAKRKDIGNLQDVLPGYIATQWENEAAQLHQHIEKQVAQMQNELQDYIESDIRSYIESGVDMAMADYIFCLTNMYGSKDVVAQAPEFAFEEKTDVFKSLLSSGETTLMTAAIGILILSHPLLGAGAAVLGLKKQKNKLLAENRQGLFEAADKMSRELFDQVVVNLDSTIKSLEDSLNTAVESCYQKIMDTMVQALTARKHDRNSYADKLEQLNATKAEMAALLKQ